MDLSRFPRRRYSEGATPLEFLPNFTNALGGPKVWIKRDDMLGLAPGGNKTRKLEFLVADALAQGADTLITCGAPQSNHCRITLAAAIKEGLHCRFVIEERVPNSYQREASGNNFLFRLLGVEAITVVPGGADMAAAMQQVATALATQGRKGYIIPVVVQTPWAGWAMWRVPRNYSSSFLRKGSISIMSWWRRAVQGPMADYWLALSATTSPYRLWVSGSAAIRPSKSLWCIVKPWLLRNYWG